MGGNATTFSPQFFLFIGKEIRGVEKGGRIWDKDELS